MNANDLLLALNDADDAYVWQAAHAGSTIKMVSAKKKPRRLMRVLIAAIIILSLSATAYGIREVIGIRNDRWLQTPALDPLQVVREAISRQLEKEYTVSVTVEEILVDDAETQKVYDWVPDSMLALRNGYGSRPEALEGKGLEDFKAVYARYTVVYDHEKTFYRDGTLNQYFYLVRDKHGNWMIFDSSDEQELTPIPEEPSTEPSEAGSEPAPAASSEYDGAIETVTEMVKKWEVYEDVDRVTVDAAAYDPAQTEAALQHLAGTTLAQGNGWTEAYLKNHMAAITVTYTVWYAPDPQLPEGSHVTETATYWLLRDPATGTWSNSEITGIMDAAN